MAIRFDDMDKIRSQLKENIKNYFRKIEKEKSKFVSGS